MDAYSDYREIPAARSAGFLSAPLHQILAYLAALLCFLLLVDGAIPQLELLFGQSTAGNAALKVVLVVAVVLGCVVRKRIKFAGLPWATWALCMGYLLLDILHLVYDRRMSFGDVLLSYNAYYVTLLVGPAFLAFRGVVSERIVIRSVILLLLICGTIGIAQHFTAQPIVYTESVDGSFRIQSWDFFGEVRAFSLFTSAMEFGMFCALCGALGVALWRRFPVRAALLIVVSAVACYATLTRLCYLVFVCACVYVLVLTLGKSPRRGLWQPFLFCVLGFLTIWVGLYSAASSSGGDLQDTSSIVDRLSQWAYYADLLLHSNMTDLSLGVGIVQNEKILPRYPMIIDNVPLALVLHVGLVGLVLFSVLMIKMWLYLRRQAITVRQPFIIAAASLWATLACAGIFNIVYTSFGIVFALAVLCAKEDSNPLANGE